MLLKKYQTHQLRYVIYLNTHWQSTLGSAAVRETSPLAEPPMKDFTDAKRYYSKKENKIQHFFRFNPIFVQISVAIQQILGVPEYLLRTFCIPSGIFVIERAHKYSSKIDAKQILAILGVKTGIPAQFL